MLCTAAPRSAGSLSICPNSDESGKQSLYPDGDPDRHQNLIICSLAPLPTFPENFVRFLHKVANSQSKDRQTDRQTDKQA